MVSGNMEFIQRGTLSKIEKNDGKTSKLLVTFHDGDSMIVEHYEPWGFAGYPMGEAEAVVFTPFGNFDSAFCGMLHDRRSNRPPLLPGESCLYSDADSYFKIGEYAEIRSTSLNIEVSGPVAIKSGPEELIKVLSDLVEALTTASKAGSISVTNELLPSIALRLKTFQGLTT
jgi:phage gp45-like